MIKELLKSGKTEEEAIKAALDELGLERDDVSVEIIDRAKSGFLGIGAVKAKVKVSYEIPDEPKPAKVKPVATEKPVKAEKTAKDERPAQSSKNTKPSAKKEPKKEAFVRQNAPAEEKSEFAEIRNFLTGLLKNMDVEANIDITEKNGTIDVTLSGPSMGSVIGRRGETLDAIQHLTNYACGKGNDKRPHINVDAEGYRSKREESLVKLAEKMAEKAIKYKRSMALEPMNSYERHVIHTALQNYDGVTTTSTGTEPNRRVVVNYVKPANEPEEKPKTREWA